MALICTIEAGLQGSETYRAGGVGPLLSQERTRTPFELDAFLERTLRAFEKLGEVHVELLFAGETEVYRAGEDDDEGVSIQELVEWTREELEEADATSFHLILTHDDRDFSHVFSIEAEADHDPQDPAIAVLDAAEPHAAQQGGPTFAGDEPNEGEPLPGLRDYGDREDELLDRLETFMQRLTDGLHRELALDDPEIESWVDELGEYDMLRHYAATGAEEDEEVSTSGGEGDD